MESSTIPSEAGAPPVGQDLTAVESRVTALEGRVDALETKGIAGGGPEPTNPGENLTPTPSNPELTPDQPGVEPGDAPAPSAGDNAPATTNPEGDTSKQNAPQPPAPEPGGLNTTTNPGTSTDDGQGQSQVETPDPEGTPAEPQPTQPAAEASPELPLYVDVTADKTATWEYTPPFTAAGLYTPDGRPLYHYAGDTAGQEATGAKDGTIGIYADDVLVPAPETDQAAS